MFCRSSLYVPKKSEFDKFRKQKESNKTALTIVMAVTVVSTVAHVVASLSSSICTSTNTHSGGCYAAHAITRSFGSIVLFTCFLILFYESKFSLIASGIAAKQAEMVKKSSRRS